MFNSYYADMGEWVETYVYTVQGHMRGLSSPDQRSIHPYEGNNLFIIPL